MAGKSNEKIITMTCSFDGGGRCLLKLHVTDSRIMRIGTDNQPGPGVKGLHPGAVPERCCVFSGAVDPALEKNRRKGQRPV